MKFWMFLPWLLTTPVVAADLAAPAIIPLPQKMEWQAGEFRLRSDTKIFANGGGRPTAGQLAEYLRGPTKYPLPVFSERMAGKAPGNYIILTLKKGARELGREGYELTVTTNVVSIQAAAPAGLFYGVQTLRQLLPPEIYATTALPNQAWIVPTVHIIDWPRFPWRGMMLDVSRHFFTKTEVEQLIEVAAADKINVFHWHLVDDNGWRVEINKYPKLTQIGAWRHGVEFGLATHSTTAYGPDGRYGGFYTQADIREVVAYAQARHVTIVPEIEMPGHSAAALAAYPELSCTGQPQSTDLGAGVHAGVYCAGKEETFEFLQNVLTEIFALFPSPYIHIGGDEVPKGNWQHCEHCQARMLAEGLKNEEELQSYFIKRMETFVNAHHKQLIGWSEILQGGLAKNATVMDWIGGGREAASQGHDVVMTPTSNCYFDYYQGRDHTAEPRAIGGYLPLEKVYAFEPIPAGLAPAMTAHILGAQGNVWTEYIPNLKQVEYMLFPRLTALAEITWSAKSSHNFSDFTRRLEVDNQRLDAGGVNFRRYVPDGRIPIGAWEPAVIKDKPSPWDIDLPTAVVKAGRARVNLEYTDGACGIDITGVALLADGQVISQDTHAGFTGANPRDPVYTLEVPAPKPGVHYTLRAQVAGSGGTDSAGTVYWEESPASQKP